MDSTTISRSQCLTPADARNMLRLSNSLHRSPGDPVMRKRILLQGIARLVEAHGALSVVTTCDRLTARQTVISVVRTDPPDAPVSPSDPPDVRAVPLRLKRGGRIAQLAAPDSAWPPRALPVLRLLHRPARHAGGRDPHRLSPGRRCAPVLAARTRDRQRRACRDGLGLWAGPVDDVPEALALPPRKRETLQYLLAGDRETQIAAKVEMSRATIHNHVKSLYRHFNVATRNELLEKWSKRKEPGPPAVP